MRSIKAFFYILVVALCFLFADAASAAQRNDADIKAVFLFNFFDFLTWPEHSTGRNNASANVCIVGNTRIQQALNFIAKRKTLHDNRKLDALYIDETLVEAMDFQQCQTIYIGDVEEVVMHYILKMARGRSILTVSDRKGFAELGGGIEFSKERTRVGLIVNQTALKIANLRINPKLLALARVIKSEPKHNMFYPLRLFRIQLT